MEKSQGNKGDFATVYLMCGKATASVTTDVRSLVQVHSLWIFDNEVNGRH